MPLPLSQIMHRVPAEHTNGETRPSQFEVLAKKTKLRGLLKWLTARKGHTFYAGAGKNPVSNFLHQSFTTTVEYVAGRVPAAGATQITSLRPYHGPGSGTVHGASRQHRVNQHR